MATGSSSVGLAPPPPALLMLDAERLNVLLDLVCADYVTASFASRENAKKVLAKALAKLRMSVGASASAAPDARTFADDVALALAARRAELQQQAHGPQLAEDALAREVLKPKLLAAVSDMCRERDRQLAAAAAATSAAGASGGGSGSTRALLGTSGANSTSAAASAPAMSALPGGHVLHGHAVPPAAGEIRMEGWLRKKGQHVTLWRERYFMIRSTPSGAHYLCYFRKKGEKDPRGWYVLGPGTTVDEVRESPSKIETKKLFTFRIRHLAHVSSEDVEDAAAAAAASASASADGGALVLPPPFTPGRAGGGAPDFPSSPDTANEHELDAKPSAKKLSSRRFRNRAAAAAAAATAATAVVLTGGLAGVGIGMGVGMSAAAAASAGAAGAMIAQNRSKGPIALAAESLETAVWWRNSILECIAQAEEQWKRYLNWYMDKEHDHHFDTELSTRAAAADDFADTPLPASPRTPVPPFLSAAAGHALSGSSLSGTGRARTGSFGTVPRSIAKTFRTSATFSQETSWKLYDFSSRLRVDVERATQHGASAAGAPPPALRTSMKVLASPKTVFEMLMKPDSAFYRANHVIDDVQILEEHPEDHSDVVYWKLAPTFLWPVHVEARNLCLLRYWRKEQDSSYFICFQSTTHAKSPVASAGSVTASVMGGGFIISPRVQADESVEEECWVTLTVQMNPKGWIDTALARSCYYAHAYGVYFLEMITAIASSTAGDTAHPPRRATLSGDGSDNRAGYPAGTVSTSTPSSQLIVSETAFPILEPFRTDLAVEHGLPTKFWSEPDAAGFFVRGPQYLSTRAKVPSARQALRLVNVELFKSADPIEHIGLSSFAGYERGDGGAASGGLARPYDQTHVLVVNFMIPGPPQTSLVLYFTPEDPGELVKSSAFAELFHQFYDGADDAYRSKRMKLIPRVVQGTWPIREGVGTTPAILGTKTYQKYFRGTQYLEVDYDIGSSMVAASLCKMLLGYSRDLIIDLAFVLEGQSREELPERVLGCVRLDCVDLRHAVQYKPAAAKESRS
ncbi:hypothetical protein PybrP1_005086 [[Pythium] brassicae (nom. inval.)]|nr:hypothetical protein PybrP1_005086 [[Pythium] brassicae (nom. inval.)]